MHLYFCQSYFFLLYFSYFGAITSHIECNRVESCSTYFRITPTYLDIKAFRPSITHFLIKQYQSKPDVQYHKRERIKKTPGIYLQCCIFIVTYLNFSHLQSTLHLMQYTYVDFFTAQNSFWTCQFWCLLVLLVFFVVVVVVPLPHRQNVSLWGLFSPGTHAQKSHLGWDWMNRKGGTHG